MSLAQKITDEIRDTDTFVLNRLDNKKKYRAGVYTGKFLKSLFAGEKETSQSITNIGTQIINIFNEINEINNSIINNNIFGKFIISGGSIWTGVGLTFATNVNFNYYGIEDFASGVNTLNPGGSLPRFDLPVVVVLSDTEFEIQIIQGIPGENPGVPGLTADNQIPIQPIFIPAFATEPDVSLLYLYREGFETGVSGETYNFPIGSTQVGSVHFLNEDDPCVGDIAIKSTTSSTTGIRINFPPVDLNAFQFFAATVKLLQPIPTGTNLLMSTWVSGSSVGSPVNYMAYGLDRNSLECQTVIIPVSALAPPQSIDRFQIRLSGGNANAVYAFTLDQILFTTGFPQPNLMDVVSISAEGNLIATRPNINFISGPGIQILAQDNVAQDRVDVTIVNTADGVASGNGGIIYGGNRLDGGQIIYGGQRV